MFRKLDTKLAYYYQENTKDFENKILRCIIAYAIIVITILMLGLYEKKVVVSIHVCIFILIIILFYRAFKVVSIIEKQNSLKEEE